MAQAPELTVELPDGRRCYLEVIRRGDELLVELTVFAADGGARVVVDLPQAKAQEIGEALLAAARGIGAYGKSQASDEN